MALSAEQLAVIRQLGGLMFGSGLHQGLSWDEAQGLPARVNGRPAVEHKPVDTISAAIDLAALKRSEPINFDAGIVFVPGPAQNNALYVDTPENHSAFIRQTQEEHDAALDKYLKDKRFADNPERAVRLGVKEEEKLPKWWNDHDPRLPVTPSSSCVSRARIGDDGDIYITFGTNPNKEYQYEGSPDPVEASRILAQLVTSNSIGRSVNSWSGFWGKSHTYLPK